MGIRQDLDAAIKQAMRDKNRLELQTLRMVSAALKQIEIDQRIEVSDEVALRELTRLLKQRQDAAQQFRLGERFDLAEQEEAEMEIIKRFLPAALSSEEWQALIQKTLSESALPQQMSSMKAIMNLIRPQLEGRVDMAEVSQYLRQLLG